MILRLSLLLLLFLALQSCSSLNHSGKDTKLAQAPKKRPESALAQFDRKTFSSKPSVIEKMISIVQPELQAPQREKLARQMSKALQKHKIAPQVMVAIVDTESNFSSGKVSSTGDLSVAQINPEVWDKELVRLKREPLDKERLKSDQEYALTKMAEILAILKERYGSKDRRWYARYHSSTKKFKKEYLRRLEVRMKMLALSVSLNKENEKA